MELRNYPGMTYRGICNWPPTWTQPQKDEPPKTLRGEIGVLAYVLANEKLSSKCFLVIDHEKERYVGALLFDDLAICRQICWVLKTQTGRPIKDIGDLDITHML
jgi:hypothetical protein